MREHFMVMLDEAWESLGGGERPAVELTRPQAYLGSPLAVDALACATAASALAAAAELAQARGRPRPTASLDAAHVAWAFRSERVTRVPGAASPVLFDPLSSFMRSTDGWVRLHGNYPHHRAALCRGLGLPERAEPDMVRAAVSRLPSVEVEDAVVAAGGCAAALRTEAEWRSHPHGGGLAARPLLDFEIGEEGAEPLPPAGALPATGIRVLDLTRVIAGPVGTRTLAALGATVLRIDPPHLPEIPHQALDTGPGKHSALLDLRSEWDRFDSLLAHADVLVQGYRPGALAALGLDPAELARRHPSLTTVTLSAWGDGGPWAERRGFDSLVQVATGIAAACGSGEEPGALPAQALDHGTGHLVAAAALRGLTSRARHGRAAHSRLALARTAGWLLRHGRSEVDRPSTTPPADEFEVALGAVRTVRPPGRLDGAPLGWSRPPVPIGSDPAEWPV